MKKTLLIVAVAGLASAAAADSYSHNFNVSWPSSPGTGGTGVHNFVLPNVVSIDRIEFELAHTWGNDLRILITGPDGADYRPMDRSASTSGTGNFDLGLVAGSGALANIALYTFIQAGPTQWIAPASPTGTYNAHTWSGGSYSAGGWTVEVIDAIGGDGGAVGNFTIHYTVPTPGALALLGMGGLVAARRRRA